MLVFLTDALYAGLQLIMPGEVAPTHRHSPAALRFIVEGAGADIWGTADAFHFAYRTLSGDGTIVARVASVAGADPYFHLMIWVNTPGVIGIFVLMAMTAAACVVYFVRRNRAAGTPTGGLALHPLSAGYPGGNATYRRAFVSAETETGLPYIDII